MAKVEEIDQDRAGEAKDWIEQVLGQKIKGDFFEAIKDGVMLCEVCNKIQADVCKKYKKSEVAFVCRTNIQIYLEACKKLGVPAIDCFESRDLYDQQRLNAVVNNIYALSAASRNIKGFKGPFIGVKYAAKNVRNFTPEQLNKGKSAVPLWNQGDINIKQENIDAYGIVKGKDMDKHSGVQSGWEKGSLKNDVSSQHDSYGIVKAKGMDKHSNVQSGWEKGSLQQDVASQHDSYGIVKAKNMDKHSNVQSGWEKGSLQQDVSSQHDSYGIVKAKGMDKHSGAQSNWEKGALQQDISSQHDSYGIVKVKGVDKHSNVQSNWEKGSLDNAKGKQLDSYGIIKNVDQDDNNNNNNDEVNEENEEN